MGCAGYRLHVLAGPIALELVHNIRCKAFNKLAEWIGRPVGVIILWKRGEDDLKHVVEFSD